MAARIAVVGGGAAGIVAALSARAEGADVVLFERNRRPGIKILISGGGKCNITHDAGPRELEKGFVRREARFLRYAFHEFPPSRLLDALHAEGLETVTRPNGRVFPASGRAEDVLAVFERMLAQAEVEVRTGVTVQGIELAGTGGHHRVLAGDHAEPFDAVIVTTGGMSYRKVGTTGDGIRWAEAGGHRMVPVRAALAPIYFPSPPPPGWQGVALRDVRFWLQCGDASEPAFTPDQECPWEWEGDLLLTHRGVSGPAVLEVSRAAALLAGQGATVRMVVDTVPTVGDEQLRDRWAERANTAGRSEVQTFVEQFVPRALVPYLLSDSGVPAGVKLGEATRAQRTAILGVLKHWVVGAVGEVPVDRGEVTAGGVALSEVSPRTMMSQHVPGLFFAGEVLDVSGSVGGYNLQAAFATGYVAGRAAAAI